MELGRDVISLICKHVDNASLAILCELPDAKLRAGALKELAERRVVVREGPVAFGKAFIRNLLKEKQKQKKEKIAELELRCALQWKTDLLDDFPDLLTLQIHGNASQQGVRGSRCFLQFGNRKYPTVQHLVVNSNLMMTGMGISSIKELMLYFQPFLNVTYLAIYAICSWRLKTACEAQKNPGAFWSGSVGSHLSQSFKFLKLRTLDLQVTSSILII
jgi:hypothetical protein